MLAQRLSRSTSEKKKGKNTSKQKQRSQTACVLPEDLGRHRDARRGSGTCWSSHGVSERENSQTLQ